MNENKIELIFGTAMISILVSSLTFIIMSSLRDNREEVPPMSKQNVVCDLVYGVQYFEHDGSLTMRVNHEGTPIRCFKEEN